VLLNTARQIYFKLEPLVETPNSSAKLPSKDLQASLAIFKRIADMTKAPKMKEGSGEDQESCWSNQLIRSKEQQPLKNLQNQKQDHRNLWRERGNVPVTRKNPFSKKPSKKSFRKNHYRKSLKKKSFQH